MDLNFFLEERLKFANYYYVTGSSPFNNIIEAIEKEQEPYIPTDYDESGEPPFLTEWLDAQTGLQSVGITALSMHSSALQLFLNEWVSRFENEESRFKRTHRKGWFNAYKKVIEDVGLSLTDSPADLNLLEQAVLARNRGQHPDELTSLSIRHSSYDLEKHPSLYFVSNEDKNIIDDANEEPSWWLAPHVHVDLEKLSTLSEQVKIFCSWLEAEYWKSYRACL
jgi:hypothetical protein